MCLDFIKSLTILELYSCIRLATVLFFLWVSSSKLFARQFLFQMFNWLKNHWLHFRKTSCSTASLCYANLQQAKLQVLFPTVWKRAASSRPLSLLWFHFQFSPTSILQEKDQERRVIKPIRRDRLLFLFSAAHRNRSFWKLSYSFSRKI